MYYIGIDLGGSSIKAGLLTEHGQIVMKNSKKTRIEKGPETIIADMADLTEQLLAESELEGPEVNAVGVGVPGATRDDGLVYFAPNIFWTNVPLAQLLREKLRKPVFVENDATVAAVAEHTGGITREVANSIFITLGTGIGGGFIINHQVFSGSHGIGAEIGHMVVGHNPDYNCSCGNNGCWETFVSGTAMVKHAEKLVLEGEKSLLMDVLGGNPKRINVRHIFECARTGDQTCIKVVDRMTDYLALGIANLINIFDPEIIALGGGISASTDLFINELKEQVKGRIYVKRMNVTQILPSMLGNEAGIIGSAMYAKNRKLNAKS